MSDLISRQAVLDLIEHYNSDGLGSVFYGYQEGVKFADAVNKLPSAKQEPKFIAKSDGTIEQIKNCNDCLFKKEWGKIGKLISTILEKQTEQEPRWIPVSEDLPKPKDAMSKISDDVLVTDGLDMFVAWYHRDDRYKEWRSTDRSYDKDTPIIAWMPLPKPYEVGSEE